MSPTDAVRPVQPPRPDAPAKTAASAPSTAAGIKAEPVDKLVYSPSPEPAGSRPL